MKACFVFVMTLMTVAVNVDDNVVARLGFEQNYLIMALFAVVIAGLTVHRNLLLIVLVLALSTAANMPEHFMLNFGLDRDYFTGVLVAVVLVPVIGRFIE